MIDNGSLERSQVAGGFFTSPEFADTGLYIIKLYIAVLGRNPDLAAGTPWFSGYRAGLPLTTILNGGLAN